MAVAREGWKRSGLVRGTGIPAPSGSFTVGCVDLMHKFEDEPNSLLVRLFYPCDRDAEAGGYKYALWIPHKRYSKGYMEYKKSKAPGLMSMVFRTLTEPRMPALYGAPMATVAKERPAGETACQSDVVEQPVSQGDTVEVDRAKEGTEDDPTSESTTASGVTSGPDATPSSDNTMHSPGVANGTSNQPFPVIVFSHGLGAMRTTYSAIECDLASSGYVVAAVEHRDRSACVSMSRVPKPGGREGELQDDWLEYYHLQEGEKEFPIRNSQVKQRAVDARRTLDLMSLLNDGGDVGNMLAVKFDFSQFKGRMDIATAAIMGHSFGGATTIQTLSEDRRFKCGIGLDTWMLPIHKDLYENGSVVEQPLIFINSFDFQWKENVQQMTKMTKPPNEKGMTTSRLITLKGTNHVNQADILFVVSSIFYGSQNMSPLDPYVAHEVNMDICNEFLKRHLLLDSAYQGPIPNLDGSEGHSEHILFGTNVDISENVEQEMVVPQEVAVSENHEQEVVVPQDVPITENHEQEVVEDNASTQDMGMTGNEPGEELGNELVGDQDAQEAVVEVEEEQ